MPDTAEPQLITVLSFSRSGSSLLSSILDRVCGISFGESVEHQAPTSANPGGYCENEEIVRINDALLQAGGGSVFQPPPVNFCLTLDGRACEQFLYRMKATMRLCSQGRANFGWKDPRTAYTLPLWRLAIPNLKAIIVLRDPGASAASFRAQYGPSVAAASNLWFESYYRIFLHSAGMQRHTISLESLLAHPLPVIQSLGRFLGVELSHDDIQAKLAGLIRAEMIGRHSLLEPALYSPSLDANAKLLYHLISPSLAEMQQPDYAHLGSVLNGLVTFRRMHGVAAGPTAEETNELERYANALRQAQDLIAERQREVIELTAGLQAAETLAIERMHELEKYDRALRECQAIARNATLD